MTTVARALADFAVGLRYETVPEPVRARARELALHFLAVAARGTRTASSGMARRAARALSGPGPATVIGGDASLAPQYAALANGATAHALELDDVTEVSSLHPGVVVFPAALAMAEARQVDTREFLVAAVVGYEVMGRLGNALHVKAHYARGFHPTATCGAFAAAAVAARLAGLDATRTAHALGIAGSLAAGSMAYLDGGALTKRTHPGLAAHAGILAAHLAAEGVTGPARVFEGEQGFFRAYADGGEPERAVAGLGRDWETLDVAIKPHACCRHNHAAIDAVLAIVGRHDLAPRDVAAIVADIPSTGMPIVAEPRAAKRAPDNVVDAQFSLPYALAVAVRYRRAFLTEYTEAVLGDPEVRRLMAVVECRGDAELEARFPAAWPARVTVRTAAGATHTVEVRDPKGSPKHALTREELTAQVRTLLADVLAPADAEALIAAAGRLDGLPDVASLLKPLRALRG
ncbi:MAG TPA: MmgE/PrpD family protein [Methylomirabilota bacterium]|jgi:2-methylcitrate dehydratase PrpD|nr:MmgE/PrpD family protein [Methylomirabilota bacterium]